DELDEPERAAERVEHLGLPAARQLLHRLRRPRAERGVLDREADPPNLLALERPDVHHEGVARRALHLPPERNGLESGRDVAPAAAAGALHDLLADVQLRDAQRRVLGPRPHRGGERCPEYGDAEGVLHRIEPGSYRTPEYAAGMERYNLVVI